MKFTDTELEEILNKLVASTRSPRGRFSATASYPELEKRLKSYTRRLTLIRTFSAAAAVALLCLSVWTAYLYMQPVTIQTVSTLAETRTVCLPDGSTVTLNHYSSLSYPEKFKSDKREVELNGGGLFWNKQRQETSVYRADWNDWRSGVGNSLQRRCLSEQSRCKDNVIVRLGSSQQLKSKFCSYGFEA